jgi:hypothetical protein
MQRLSVALGILCDRRERGLLASALQLGTMGRPDEIVGQVLRQKEVKKVLLG